MLPSPQPTNRAAPRATRSSAPAWPRCRCSAEFRRCAAVGGHQLRATADPYAVVGGARTPAAYSWSNFSHNVAGILLLAMSLLALRASRPGARVARHWPLGIAVLGVFVFLRSMAVDAVWPFGPRAFWATSMASSEDLQHRLAGLLALTLGLVEWRARRTEHPAGRLPYVFPVLAVGGGLLLLTHSHVAFELKSNYLVQVTHTTMGALAVLLGCGRLLELRLASPAGRIAGIASSVAMLLIALVLVFYREANVIVPSDATIASAAPEAAADQPATSWRSSALTSARTMAPKKAGKNPVTWKPGTTAVTIQMSNAITTK